MRRQNPFEVFISFKTDRSLKYVKYKPSVYHVVYDQKRFLLGRGLHTSLVHPPPPPVLKPIEA